jgi:phage portal protein BeeE
LEAALGAGVEPGSAVRPAEPRAFQIEEICRALRCMPIMVGHNDKSASYASSEQMFLAHENHDLLPWGVRVEQRAARSLLTVDELDSGLYPKIMFQARLRSDPKSRAEFYQRGITDGWMTRNEVRAFEDMNPIDGLDEILSPLNMVLGNPPPAEPAPAEPAPPALTPPAKGVAHA